MAGPEDAVDASAVEAETVQGGLQRRRRRRRAVGGPRARAGGHRACQAASTRASQVASSHVPLTWRPRWRWNARTWPRGGRAEDARASTAAGGTRRHRGGVADREWLRRADPRSAGEVRVVRGIRRAPGAGRPCPWRRRGAWTTSPPVEHEQRRDAHHVVPHRELGVVVDVELGDRELLGRSLAISSRIGAIILHGPHHSAQKSTMTGLSEPMTVSSKVVVVEVDDAVGHGEVLSQRCRGGKSRRARNNPWATRTFPAVPRPAGGSRRTQWWTLASSQRSASMAAMQPEPAAVIA